MATATLEVLEKLREMEWRGIKVPCMLNSLAGGHTLVEHQGYGMPGAEVENTGRKSGRFQFTIPFRNGIAGYGVLYPTVFREFWNAYLDPTTGDLLHPEFGLVDCKASDWTVTWDPSRRDGVDMQVTFVETVERDMGLEGAAASPITNAIALADDVLELGEAVELPPYDDGSGDSLSAALRKLKGMAMLANITAAGMLSEIEKTAEAVNNLIDYANTLSDPAAYPVLQSLEGIGNALMKTAEQTGASSKQKVEIKTTTQEATPMLTAVAYGVTIEQLFRYNPMLATMTTVPVGTLVFVPSK